MLFSISTLTTKFDFATKEELSNLLFIDSLADHNFFHNLEIWPKTFEVPFTVNGATGEGEGSLMAGMYMFSDAAYLPHCRKNAIAECNLHRFDPQCVP